MFFIYKACIAWAMFPGIIIVLLILLTLIRIYKSKKVRKTDIIVWIIVLLLYVPSTPLVSGTMMEKLESKYVPIDVPNTLQYKHMIILGSGVVGYRDGDGKVENVPTEAVYPRLMEAFKIYTYAKSQGQEDTIYITGGGYGPGYKKISEAEVYKATLVSLGIPESDILIETKSQTTYQNAKNSLDKFGADNLNGALLLTSAFHMPRAYATFKSVGLSVIPDPSGYLSKRPSAKNLYNYLPDAGSMRNSVTVINEKLGMLKAR